MHLFNFTQDQTELGRTVDQFAKSELSKTASEWDEKEYLDSKIFQKFGSMGLLGVTAKEEFGGLGLGAIEATLVMEKMAQYCASTTLSYLAHSILCVNNISENASLEQKKRYLPKLIKGEWVGAMGMTEPNAGSDALGIQTKATKKGNKYILNGAKTFITNGPIADIFVIYAKTGNTKKDISTFIVEKTFKGFQVGKKLHKLGMRASPTSELIFENCEVPEENRVGEESESVNHMMRNLNIERITISGVSLGIAQAALDYSLKYVKERKQFDTPLSEFQMVQDKIATMATQLEAGRSLTYLSAQSYDGGNRKLELGSMAKLFTAPMATHLSLEAVQLLGGYGYTKEYPVERYLRDSKLMEIGAGTNEIMKIIIAREILGS